MIVTVIAAWMVGSQKKFKRNWGFWLFLLSNVLWIVWGFHDHAYALIFLQLCLAFINIRGALKNVVSNVMVSGPVEVLASITACRNEPAPLSLSLVTVMGAMNSAAPMSTEPSRVRE